MHKYCAFSFSLQIIYGGQIKLIRKWCQLDYFAVAISTRHVIRTTLCVEKQNVLFGKNGRGLALPLEQNFLQLNEIAPPALDFSPTICYTNVSKPKNKIAPNHHQFINSCPMSMLLPSGCVCQCVASIKMYLLVLLPLATHGRQEGPRLPFIYEEDTRNYPPAKTLMLLIWIFFSKLSQI